MSVVDLAAMARAVGDAADDHAGDCPSDSCAACCAAAAALVQLRALREACDQALALVATKWPTSLTWQEAIDAARVAIRSLGEPPKEGPK